MVQFSRKQINRVRKMINEQSGRQFGRSYRRRYQGQLMEHISIEYKYRNPENKRQILTKYMAVPLELFEKAERSNRLNKFTPVKVVTTDAKYGGKGQIKQQIYQGKYTIQEIISKAQRISNTLSQRGRRGQISVSLHFFGRYRRAPTTPFGSPVKVYEIRDYDFDHELPEHFTGFALNIIYE